MSRLPAISYEEVANICAQIATTGQRPTIARVAVALGNKGSTRVISSYLTRYFEDSGRTQQIEQRMRPGWDEAQNAQADSFLNKLRDLAFDHERQAFDHERQAMQAQFETLLERVQVAEEAAIELTGHKEKLEETLQQQSELLAQQRDERNALLGELEHARADLASTQAKLEHAVAEVINQKDATATLERELNARREQEVEQVRASLTIQLQTAVSTHAAELARERETAQGERAYLMEQTYALRQALNREKETLEKTLADTRQELEQSRTLATQYRTDLAVERGRQAERSMQLEKTQQTLETQQARTRELEHKLTILATRQNES